MLKEFQFNTPKSWKLHIDQVDEEEQEVIIIIKKD